MSRYLPPSHRLDVERVALKATARRRQLTGKEDQRLAELSFIGDRRGSRLRLPAPERGARA